MVSTSSSFGRSRLVAAWLAVIVFLAGSGAGLAQTPLPEPPAVDTGDAVALGDLGWAEDAVCYEIFVRSFFDTDADGVGDLNGVIARLDYLNDGDPATTDDLGVTCVWLMPIFESTSYHGYDVEDYYRVDAEYGTNDDFTRLVDEAHARGIRVVLDLVLNHTSDRHPWFVASQDPASSYRDWYVWEATDPDFPGPFGGRVWHPSPAGDGSYYYGLFIPGMPDLNYRNPAVTEEARQISAFWLDEMGADGFRLDAIKHLIEDGRIQENSDATFAWLREYGAWLRDEHPDALTIGEIFGATTQTLVPYFPDQLDAYFLFDLGAKIIGAVDGGTGIAFSTIAATSYERLPPDRTAPFLSNHDQTRSMTTLGGDIAKAKLAATTYLTLPGIPFIYYGEEIGITGDKPDENLRTPMQWTADPITGGFTEGTPWRAPQPDAAGINVAAQEGDPDSLLNHYRALVRLHAASPAISRGGFAALRTDFQATAYIRHDPDSGDIVLVIVNFDDEPLDGATIEGDALGLPAGTYALEPLLVPAGTPAAATLTVSEDGAMAEQSPLGTLEAQAGYVYRLVAAA